MRTKSSFFISGAGKLNNHTQGSETVPFSYIIYKNKLECIKLLEKNIGV